MAESGWAKRMGQEFKAGKARKTEKEGKLQEEQRVRGESASRLWREVREAFKEKAGAFNATAGEEILAWEAASVDTFTLSRKDTQGCVKGTYQEAGCEVKIEVLGRVVPLKVTLEHRTGKYQLLDPGAHACEPEELAETLIGEFLGKH